MAETTTLREVDWIDFDYVYQDGTRGKVLMCDICYQSGLDDVPNTLRKFYYDDAEQLTVCEHCVKEYLEENANG